MNHQTAYPFPSNYLADSKLIIKNHEVDLILNWKKETENLLDSTFEKINLSETFPKTLKRPLFSISERLKRINESNLNNIPLIESKANILTIIERSSNLKECLDSPGINKDLRRVLLSLINQIKSIGKYLNEELLQVSLFGNSKNLIQREKLPLEDLERKILTSLEGKIYNSNKKIEKSLSEINKIENKISLLDDRISQEFHKAIEKTIQSSNYLDEKKRDIEDLVGIVSGTAVFGSYEETAKDEKLWANITRGLSVILMLIIAGIVGSTIWSSTGNQLNWETSIIRLISSLVLSVPAAYLAREAEKHRLKYNEYKKTAMDLKSINPYTDSLPEDQKNTLKAEMANRLFNKSNNENLSSSYPIDLQALLLAIVEKINGNQATLNKQDQDKK